MQAATNNAAFETDPLIDKIRELASRGLTDAHIAQLLGKHHKTIIYHRKRHGIASGRSRKAALTAEYRKIFINKRTYKAFQNLPSGKIKHGLNAYAPMPCYANRCPYRVFCDINVEDMEPGMPCVVEAVFIVTRLENYCKHFQATADNYVIISAVQHLVNVEVKIMRCNRLMAMDTRSTYKKETQYGSREVLNPVYNAYFFLIREWSRVVGALRELTGII